ncbi:hypothetical protein AAVH_40977, partial [Aphelenchoides avenae]
MYRAPHPFGGFFNRPPVQRFAHPFAGAPRPPAEKMPFIEFVARECKCSEYSVEEIVQGPEGPRIASRLQSFRVFGKLEGGEYVIIFPSEFEGKKLMAVHRKPNAQWDMDRVAKCWELQDVWVLRRDALGHLQRRERPQRTSFPPPAGTFAQAPRGSSASCRTPPPGPSAQIVEFGPAPPPANRPSGDQLGERVNVPIPNPAKIKHREATTQTDCGTWIPGVQQPDLYLRVKFSVSGMEILDLKDLAKALDVVDRDSAEEPSNKKLRKDSSLEEELEELDETDPKAEAEATKAFERSKAAAEKAAAMAAPEAVRDRSPAEKKFKEPSNKDMAGPSGTPKRAGKRTSQ